MFNSPGRKVWWLPLDHLRDGLIECGDYPDWKSCRGYMKTSPYDRNIVRQLLKEIPAHGLDEPLVLRVMPGEVLMSDGHHRAFTLKLLGWTRFPYSWFREPSGGRIRLEPEPLPRHLLGGL